MATPPIPFDNTYVKLPAYFYARIAPEPSSAPRLVAWNEGLAQHLGIHWEAVDSSEKAEVFSGNVVPAGAEPIALAYAGHQFGNFVPQLGDGRAVLLGEVIDTSGVRQDIQLKGSGPTPFSRRGDGRSALGPVLREYIVSEAMHHLGVRTTRALAAVTTGDLVMREDQQAGGVFTRVAESHIRVGTFEFFAARGDQESLRLLLNYCVARYFPSIEKDDNLPLAFLQAVASRQALLIAHWMSLGFVHGVMNTDNTSVAGITIDYGPCAFLDEYQSDKVFSFIDSNGRYAFRNQPQIGKWNLTCLARALWPLFAGPEEETTRTLTAMLEDFDTQLQTAWQTRMLAKLGLATTGDDDEKLIHLWLTHLEQESLDYTLSFRHLTGHLSPSTSTDAVPTSAAFQAFRSAWWHRLECQGIALGEVAQTMLRTNPLFIPRNHQVERAIEAAYQQDFSVFKDLCAVTQKPFDDQPAFAAYALAPEPNERVRNTFCGT